jgi:hypothetical protein
MGPKLVYPTGIPVFKLAVLLCRLPLLLVVQIMDGERATAQLTAGQWFGDAELRSNSAAVSNVVAKVCVCERACKF